MRRFTQTRWVLRAFTVGTAGLVLTACSYTTTRGDAKVLQDGPLAILRSPDPIEFPRFTLSEAGKHRFAVRDLPHPAEPQSLCIPITDEEHLATDGSVDPPFVGAQVRIQFVDRGEVYLDEVVNISRPRSAQRDGDSWYVDYFIGGDRENAWRCSYDVIVEVMTPSSRAGDVAWLRGYASIESMQRK